MSPPTGVFPLPSIMLPTLIHKTMMKSVLLAVSLGMLMLEFIPSSKQSPLDDNELAPNFVPPQDQRDINDEKMFVPKENSKVFVGRTVHKEVQLRADFQKQGS
ncbi:hypothetical protein J6590_093752 [Homalodisca vitripennis]|nr:hypothetical protein J6590_075713 [Homalodisca vitripennis]KAG8299732.1 hypothetical protein J6590_093752 [Homalodisca vitripennis]